MLEYEKLGSLRRNDNYVLWGKFIIDQKNTVNKSSVNTKMKADTRAAE